MKLQMMPHASTAHPHRAHPSSACLPGSGHTLPSEAARQRSAARPPGTQCLAHVRKRLRTLERQVTRDYISERFSVAGSVVRPPALGPALCGQTGPYVPLLYVAHSLCAQSPLRERMWTPCRSQGAFPSKAQVTQALAMSSDEGIYGVLV